MSNRKLATEHLLKWLGAIEKVFGGNNNVEFMKKRLDGMADAEFKALMTGFRSGELFPRLIVPNLTTGEFDMTKMLAVAKQMRVKLFHRIWLTDPKTKQTYLTPLEYLVVVLPVRRQAQLLVKKISIPGDNRHVDEMTGQPTGPSKGSSISFPELQVMAAKCLDNSITELIKFRGGDTTAYNAMTKSILESGTVSNEMLEGLGSNVKVTEVLSSLLTGMHLDNNLVGGAVPGIDIKGE
jgi:hypothetical protein